MPVGVQEQLKQAQITPMTYLTLLRNVSFLGRRRKGQDAFRRDHLLALKAFALLRAHGLKISIASEAIEAAFPAISKFASDGHLPVSDGYKVGVRMLSLRGRLVTAPLEAPIQLGAEEVGRVELDLRGVAALLPEAEG